MDGQKPVTWIGSSLDDLRSFPREAVQMMGYQIERVQFGLEPEHYRNMPDVGSGCLEIRVSCSDSWFRAFYVAKWDDAVYILHAFQKKTNETPPQDIKLGKKRYKQAQEKVK